MSLETPAAPAAASPELPAMIHPAAVQPAPTPVAHVAPPVAAHAVHAQVATTPPAIQTVTIPLEQLQAFTSVQARLAQMEADQRSRDDAAVAERVKLMAQKGEVENALALTREEGKKQLESERASRAASEERAKRYALDGEVSRVLASQPLVPGGAEQLTQLWRSQFLVEPQGDSFTVRTPTFQSVGDFVATQLARPEFSHFVRATTTGGVGVNHGGAQSAPTPAAIPPAPVAPIQPKNFGEAIILQMQELQKASGVAADSRLNPAAAMSLTGRSFVKQA